MANLNLATSIGLTGKPETYANIAYSNVQQKRKEKAEDDEAWKKLMEDIKVDSTKVHQYYVPLVKEESAKFVKEALDTRSKFPNTWKNIIHEKYFDTHAKLNNYLAGSKNLFDYEKQDANFLRNDKLIQWVNQNPGKTEGIPVDAMFGESFNPETRVFSVQPVQRIDINNTDELQHFGKENLYTEMGSPYQIANADGQKRMMMDRTIPKTETERYAATQMMQNPVYARNVAYAFRQENPDYDLSTPQGQKALLEWNTQRLLNTKRAKQSEWSGPAPRAPKEGKEDKRAADVIRDEKFLINQFTEGTDVPFKGSPDKVANAPYAMNLPSIPGNKTLTISSSPDVVVYNEAGDASKVEAGEYALVPSSIKVVPVYNSNIMTREKKGGKEIQSQNIGGTVVPDDKLDSHKGKYTYKAMIYGPATKDDNNYSLMAPLDKKINDIKDYVTPEALQIIKQGEQELNSQLRGTQAKTDQKATKDWSKYKR